MPWWRSATSGASLQLIADRVSRCRAQRLLLYQRHQLLNLRARLRKQSLETTTVAKAVRGTIVLHGTLVL